MQVKDLLTVTSKLLFRNLGSGNFLFVKKAGNIEEVVRHNLCNRCGSCAGLSGGKIAFADRTGKYLPIIREPLDETTSRLVWSACSGKGFDFPAQRVSVFGDPKGHLFIGHYLKIYTGFSKDPEIRLNAASGGILSGILIWLLEKKKINDQLILMCHGNNP